MLNGKSHLIFEKCVFGNEITYHHAFYSSLEMCWIRFVSSSLLWMSLWHDGFVSGLLCRRPGFYSPSLLVFFHMIIFSKKVSFYSCFLANYCKGLNSNPIPTGVGRFWPQQQKTAWLFHTFVAKLNLILQKQSWNF